MSRSLPLLLLSLLAVLRAETPASPPANAAEPPVATAEEVPAPFRVDPNFVDPIPSTASLPPSPPEPSPPDKELEAVRGLLEAAGLRVTELDRLPEGGVMMMGEVRLALSPNPRLREMEVMMMVSRPAHEGCWRVLLTLPFDEQSRPKAAQAVLRAEAERFILRSRTLRRVVAPEPDEGEVGDEPAGMMVIASHYATAADPLAFAAFVKDLAIDAHEILDIEDDRGGYLMTRTERRDEPVRAALFDVSQRLRDRLDKGLAAIPAPGGPASEDPASHASHLIDGATMDAVLRADDASPLLAELGAKPLSIAGREAFRLQLSLKAEAEPAEASSRLRSLAYDPDTGAPRDAWALHFWACHLIDTLPDDDWAGQVVEALDALRLASRLGCERAMGLYLNILSKHDVPLVGGESHWEDRGRWQALFPHFDPHFPEESLQVERDYRAGDRSPIRIGVEAEGEELRQVRLAVEEMNTARRARGWKTFEVVVETPALDPVGEDAKKTDPAGAGSGEG